MSKTLSLGDPIWTTREASRVGRVETYIHSDTITRHKGGAMIKMVCGSEAGSRTDEFIAFTQRVARFAYAAAATGWADIIRAYPEMADELFALRKILRENVYLDKVEVMKF